MSAAKTRAKKLVVRITSTNEPFEVDEKRMYLPGTKIAGECPACDEPFEKDFADEYLSYPTMNAVNDVSFYCAKCDHNWTVRLGLELTVTLEP